MISRVSRASILQGFVKSRSFLAGNSAYIPTSFESIATATGTGSSGTISFTSIPQTYTHLEIRAITRNSNTGTVHTIRFNADSGTNYVQHSLLGDGTSATAAGTTGLTAINVGYVGNSSMTANIMGVQITSILDYTSTTKNKTTRNFNGVEDNSGTSTSIVGIRSGLWLSTSAITQIDLIASGSGNWTTATTFASTGLRQRDLMPAGATYEPIATTTLSSAQTSVTFSSLGSYTDIIIICQVNADAVMGMFLQFNSDTATNYSSTRLRGNGSTATSGRTTSSTSMEIAFGSGGMPTSAGIYGMAKIHIFSYGGSTNKTALGETANDQNGSGTVERNVGLWRSTSAITSIKLLGNGTNNFTSGSTFTLYGIKAA